ncbi:nucleolar pre-ribosomal-associated protein 1 [Physeter macrocephalus]|uniref:Nucleolar pre-ribosomal-associated protein 1 n=1 Tax=Physeter macrocephalus TaxID=9755 RepID=A0A455BJ61_PHYMC|nr:nucleolar pre-ribosomal-associated protein 1 [Physeter catodon]|eukprot:XP_028348869.1 nucleolar pre-ribosomal-associated protein 1 [Physeter catodon]
MGGPKRKAPGGQDGAAPPAGAAKRARTEELTGVRFKAQLRDPQGAGPALEAFVSAAKKLPREDVYDVVEGYLKISVECAEIFQLLSGEKRPESEMLLIFQVFEAILLRTASDLSHFHVVGTNIVKKLMNNHMKLICESLYASGYRMARACLNLMAAMVTQGPEAARDVCSHFDLNKKTLYTLVTKRDSKGVHDVRLAYIQFALSFLIAGDDSTIAQVLELKEFIPCIFSSGMKEDRLSTINMLLSTLKTKVVHNKNITKTQKVRFFTGQVLNHIASLYSWKGIVDVSLESVETSAEDAGKTMVRELVHNFLMDLCCSLKHGINFYDASLGTSGRMNSLNEVDPGDWQKFVKTGLKFRYQDHAFLKALHAAVQLLYLPESSAHSRLTQLSVVHTMLTQHSLFLPTLLTAGEEETPGSPIREALVDLMSVAVRLCPSVCESSHFAVLLGAYGASLSVLDQKILLLLRAYEQNNHSLVSFRLLPWGPAAVEHQKTCQSLGKSLWQQPSVGDILRLLDPDRMMKTVLHFPQNRRLLPPEDTQEPIFKDRSMMDLSDLYDPCFLLHLFSELTRPEFVVDCRKFVDSNALGLTVTALSSYDAPMRAAAYSVLAAYYSQLEGARFREQPQVLYLLDVVRNGIRTKNMRLTFTLTLFIAKAALQILKPEEHMYLKVNKFLLSHEYLNMNKVPGFYQFFYSSDFEQKTEREWMFGLLRQGMRDKHCYELCARRGVLHVILSFFSSPLCDDVAQNWILEILQNAARDAKSAYEILRDYSLLTWILHILEGKFLETQLLSSLISLLHTLWVTTLGDRGAEAGEQPPRKPGSQEPPKLLALHLVDEFLYVLLVLTKHLRPALASTQLTSFFGALDSVLRYRATVLQAFRDMNRFTVNETVLSTRDALVLLHQWSLVERDVRLQEDLRAAAERCQVRELLKMLKDKNKPVGTARAKGPRGRKRRPGEAEEAVDPGLPASTLEACGGLLRSILTHWGPAFPDPEPESEGPGPGDAVTALVAGWVLRSAAASPLGRAETAGLLGWLRSRILPRPAVVADLLQDSAVASGVFRLYSRFCGAEGLAGPEQGAAGLFNAVMLQLGAAHGPPESRYRPMLEAVHLSSLNAEDAATRATAAFLVSLYIKDVWLGAQRPDTLLTHVRMVLDASEDVEGGDEEAVVRLCKDIAAAIPDT